MLVYNPVDDRTYNTGSRGGTSGTMAGWSAATLRGQIRKLRGNASGWFVEGCRMKRWKRWKDGVSGRRRGEGEGEGGNKGGSGLGEEIKRFLSFFVSVLHQIGQVRMGLRVRIYTRSNGVDTR